MRFTVLLLLLPLMAACEDALGPAGSCEGQMRQVRTEFGDNFSRTSGDDGDVFWETWVYPPQGSDPGRTVTFRWGTSLNGCQKTEGPVSSKIPSRNL